MRQAKNDDNNNEETGQASQRGRETEKELLGRDLPGCGPISPPLSPFPRHFLSFNTENESERRE